MTEEQIENLVDCCILEEICKEEERAKFIALLTQSEAEQQKLYEKLEGKC